MNGFLAGSEAEWLAKLRMLCSDDKLRARVGDRARQTALAHYDVSHAVESVHQVFTKVLEQIGQKHH